MIKRQNIQHLHKFTFHISPTFQIPFLKKSTQSHSMSNTWRRRMNGTRSDFSKATGPTLEGELPLHLLTHSSSTSDEWRKRKTRWRRCRLLREEAIFAARRGGQGKLLFQLLMEHTVERRQKSSLWRKHAHSRRMKWREWTHEALMGEENLL